MSCNPCSNPKSQVPKTALRCCAQANDVLLGGVEGGYDVIDTENPSASGYKCFKIICHNYLFPISTVGAVEQIEQAGREDGNCCSHAADSGSCLSSVSALSSSSCESLSNSTSASATCKTSYPVIYSSASKSTCASSTSTKKSYIPLEESIKNISISVGTSYKDALSSQEYKIAKKSSKKLTPIKYKQEDTETEITIRKKKKSPSHKRY